MSVRIAANSRRRFLQFNPGWLETVYFRSGIEFPGRGKGTPTGL